MAIDRRRLLAGFGGMAAFMAVPIPARAGGGPLFLSAYATAGGDKPGYGVAALDADGGVVFATALPGRAHAVVPNPVRAQAVVFARRPGRWFVPLDLATGVAGAPVRVPEDRRFTGHGVFSADGRLLYVAEDDVPREAGAIAVYDVADGYRRLDAMPTHGIGPHELVALDGVRVLAVANGGVITHPDTGRAKLNLDDMDASLTYVEAASGRLLDRARLPEEHANLGIRHLAALADGSIAFGVQDERPTGALQPLVGTHRPGGGPVRLFDMPEDTLARFEGYVGSVATDGRTVAASSPRGGLVGFWDAPSGRWLGAASLPDGCGIAWADGRCVATSGHGAVASLAPDGGEAGARRASSGLRWDNHLTPMGT
ncbi:MAG TPA: DUF1513 domain-containing protein [Azospirillum sp.]